jgi:hypothetical protein
VGRVIAVTPNERSGEVVLIPGKEKRKLPIPKKGFIGDYAQRAGITYRTYSEFANEGKANIPVLENHFYPYFSSYNLGIRDTVRFRVWQREFDLLVAVQAVPRLNTLHFSNDHKEELRFGAPSPFAHEADNDLAVGMFIEHLSKSPI